MEIKIGPCDEGKTIRNLLRNDLGFSSSMLKKVKFTPGGITVNGEFRTVRYELRLGDILAVGIEDTEEDVSPYIIPVDLPLEIVCRTKDFTVINKPPHMPAHPSFGHRDDTAANALAFMNNGEPYVFRPVNRLDRDTSGAMLVANTKLSSYTLNKDMAEGNIHKKYIAAVDGVLPVKEGEIATYMRRVDSSVIKREVCAANEGGKLALTRYKVLCENCGRSLVSVSPMTGRTHQIRVHFAHLGAPVTGDSLYGSPSDGIDRQALHSSHISFPDPSTKRTVEFKAKLPCDMKSLISEYFGEIAEGILYDE